MRSWGQSADMDVLTAIVLAVAAFAALVYVARNFRTLPWRSLFVFVAALVAFAAAWFFAFFQIRLM